MEFAVADLPAAHDLWQRANGRVNARLYNERRAILKQNEDAIDVDTTETVADLSDIDQFFESAGKGPSLLEFEFDAQTEQPISYQTKSGKTSKFWYWTHRSTGTSVKRFLNISGKTFDTGKLSKFLIAITPRTPIAYQRAQHILKLNESKTEVVSAELRPNLTRKQLLLQQVRLYTRPWCCLFDQISHLARL
jgi:hypothetical protein